MKGGARSRAGVLNGNGPRRGLREDELCPENIYKIYDEAIKESSEEQSKKFKEKFKERFNKGLNEITQDQFSIISIFEEMFKKRVEAITQDQFSEIFNDEKIDLLFNQLNSASLEEHFAMLPRTTWIFKENDDDEKILSENNIIYEVERHDPNSILESKESSDYRYLCFDCYFHRRKNLKEKPKNLPELLKKINPYCDPSDEKIKKVLEEYTIYKKAHSGEEELQKEESKTALKQAINDALSIDKSKLPSINEKDLEELKKTFLKKINLALSSNSESKKVGDDISTSPDITLQSKSISESDQAFQDILFQKTTSAYSEEQDLNQPRITLDDFKNFLAENGGTNPNEEKVQEAFEAYKTYYKEALSLQNDELVQKLKKVDTTIVSEHEFNGIVSFLDRMPKAELNASLPTKPPTQMPNAGASIGWDESEPPPESILETNIKRDKVAEFKKFLDGDNLNCTNDNIQKVFALHELYEAYKPHLEKSEGEIQGEIYVSAENLEAFKNKISELIFKKELSESHQIGLVSRSSLSQVSRVRLDPQKLEKILTFLNQNQDSENIYNRLETLNSYLNSYDGNQTLVDNLKELKKVAITERLKKWYSHSDDNKEVVQSSANSEHSKFVDEAYEAYEAYINANNQEKPAQKAIILSKLTRGDQDLSKNLKALEFLKILDELNKYHNNGIASYQKKAEEKAKQEKPNEIIKFFTEIPSNILSAFGCFRTNDSSNKGSGSPTRE